MNKAAYEKKKQNSKRLGRKWGENNKSILVVFL